MNYRLIFQLCILLGLAPHTIAAQAPAFLGIEYSELSERKRKALDIPYPNGSYVDRVLSNTAAEEAGLTPMDYVYGVDDRKTSNRTSLGDILANYREGDQATLHFYHQGKPRQARIRFGSRSEAQKPERKDDVFLGISPHRDNNEYQLGVRVYVIRRSTANQMGLQDGDLITHVNGYPIVDWRDISLSLDMLEPGDQITIDLERGREQLTLFGIAESKDGPAYSAKPREKAYLGIFSRPVNPRKAQRLGFENPYGSYVSKVVPNSPADEAGLRPFDYILGVDQYRVGKEQNLTAILHKYYAGEEALVYIVRQGSKQTKPVTFGVRMSYEKEERDEGEKVFLGVRQSYDAHERGVQVSIVKGSSAQRAGMEDGDVLTHIQDYPVLDWEDITIALDQAEVGKPLRVSWLRNDQPMRGEVIARSRLDLEDEEVVIREYRGRSSGAIREVSLRKLTSFEVQSLNKATGLELATDNSLNAQQLQMSPTESGELRLSLNLPQRGRTNMQLYNDQGRLVYQYDLGDFSGQISDRISLAGNASGVFFLHIRQNGKSLTRKVLVQRD